MWEADGKRLLQSQFKVSQYPLGVNPLKACVLRDTVERHQSVNVRRNGTCALFVRQIGIRQNGNRRNGPTLHGAVQHHVHKSACIPSPDEEVTRERESGNDKDPYAVAVI